MTPYEARTERSHVQVERSLLLHVKHDRVWPDISVCDKVKLYDKKKALTENVNLYGLLILIV